MVGFDEGITVFVALGNSVGIIEGTSLLGLEEINEGSSDGDSLVDVADGIRLCLYQARQRHQAAILNFTDNTGRHFSQVIGDVKCR